jgi:hypothetical protein
MMGHRALLGAGPPTRGREFPLNLDKAVGALTAGDERPNGNLR